LNLTIKLPSSNSLSLTSCDSISVNGQTYLTSGIYIQNLINSVGCDSILTLNISINSSLQPVILNSGPTTFCLGDSVVLSISNPNQFQQFTWNFGSNAAQITADTSGLYVVNVTDNNSCSGTASILITASPCTFSFNSETIYLTTNKNVQSNIFANENNLSGILIDTIPLLAPTKGIVRVSANGEFTYTPITNFSGYDKFVLKGCNIFLDCANDTVYLVIRPLAQNDYYTTNGNANSLAATGNILDNDAGSLIQSTVTLINNVNNGTLQVNANGSFLYKPTRNYCGLDSFQYQICDTNNLCSVATCIFEVTCREITILTGFSPNGDGINDGWVLPDIEGTNNTVSIFDRWGRMVRNFTNYDNTTIFWDGTNSSGAELPSGTYFYSIEVENKKVKKGWVEITK
jgi:gliding motility-associated-like protein